MHVTFDFPNYLGEAINKFPNRNEVVTKLVDDFLKKRSHIEVKESKTETKWERLAREIKEEKPLYGLSGIVDKATEEIRGNFAFDND